MKTLVKQSKSLAQGVKGYIITQVQVFVDSNNEERIFIISVFALISYVLYMLIKVIFFI